MRPNKAAKRGNRRLLVVVNQLALALLVTASGAAANLYDTLGTPPLLRGQGNPVTYAPSDRAAVATRFSLSRTSTVTGFDLAITTTSPNVLTVDIYKDNLGVPGIGSLGQLIRSITFTSVSASCEAGFVANVASPCISVFSAVVPGGLVLAPGNYWLALSSNDHAIAWYITPYPGSGVAYLQASTNKWSSLVDAPWGVRVKGETNVFDVNSTATTPDSNPGDGVCDDGTNHCTLRAAIMEANAHPGPDTINLSPGETYTLNDTVPPDIAGLPRVTSTITLNGNGATIRRSNVPGTPLFQIFVVFHGDLTLNDVTITGGLTDNDGFGGGINSNTSTTTIVRSTISGNQAGNGGGIYNFNGTLTVINSTVSGNKTSLGGYGGGGILTLESFGTASTTVIASTIAANQADGLPGFQGRGDAVAGNTTLKNSIVAGSIQSPGSVCYAASIVSLGHNIASDGSCALTGTGDRNNTDPNLAPLGANGGPTSTHPILSASPAIDGVPLGSCTDLAGNPLTNDQRGYPRPRLAACDVGSFEVQDLLPQQIIFVQPPSHTFGDLPFSITAYSDSGLLVNLSSNSATVCSISGSQLTILGGGICSITATQPGTSLYLPALPVTRTFVVNPKAQNINFSQIANQLLGTPPFTFSASASSGLAVNLNSIYPSVCTVSGTTVTLQAQGQCTIEATQPGNANFAPAIPVTNTFRVVANVSSQISVALTGFVRNRSSNLWTSSLTLTNKGVALSGPIQVLLTNLTAGVTLTNGSGTYGGNPFITVYSGTLAAGQTATVTLQFTNPSNGFINFNSLTYAGGL